MYKRSLLSASIVFALTSTAYAQEYALFDEVVVSATRTEQNKEDVSSSIETVSSSDISKTLSTDVKQALKYTPGVNAQGSGRFGISGFNIRGMENSRVKVMVDDVQQPVPYNPGATEQRKYPNNIEIDTLQAIEINKGPSSTLYGSDALGGVVLFRTKNPEDVLVTTDGDEHRFGIKSSYASTNEEFKNTLTWAMRKGELETLLMATYANGHETQTHGTGLEVEGPDRGAANPADSELGNLLGKMFYQASDFHRFGVTVEYYNKQYNEDELNHHGYSMAPTLTYTENFNKDTNERLRVGFEHEWLLATAIADKLDWSINYQDSSSLSKNYDTTPLYGKRMRERDSGDKSIQFNAKASKLAEFASTPHELTFGANYVSTIFNLENTDYKFDQGTSGPGSSGVPDADLLQWGVFLQDQVYFLDEALVMTAGVRYDSFSANPKADEGYKTAYDKNEDTALTGKLGVVYHLNDNLSVFGQISQGFKAPTVYDLYYFYDQGAIIDANPDLKSEKSISYEAGLRGQYDSAIFELTTFFSDYKDFIVKEKTGRQGNKDVISKKNLDEVEIYGAELSSTTLMDKAFNAPQGVYTRLAIAYADGEDKKTRNALDSVAPLTADFGIGLNRATYGALANVKMVARKSDWNSDTNVDVAGYTLVDLTAYYRPMHDLTLRAGLFNAFDKKYWLFDDLSGRDATGETFSIDSKSQPGRNWGVSLDYQF
ncbi:TonB-dependent hemoglobin/transferrin/lactoferrin family receptor [Vibrio salilacus]|uniref:TonB-dependent hemoglobin/transferrin/lactoferrin family receptor n=1 Tax=Vibrio salilacus TaxID=1323749 RepID=UPI000C2A1606|nr:TonB-dependent hemoglobin/transferrin/lactoferrin family receptor [Vibrio salilacus]